MFRFLWTTDWHLGYLYGKHPNPSVVINDAARVFQYAVDHNIPHVVITGDLSDKSSMPDDLKCRLVSLLKQYDGKFHLWILRGNHDYLHDNMTSLDLFAELESLFSSVHIVSTRTVTEIDGVSVVFQPFPHDYDFDTEAEGLPPSLIFSHIDVVGGKADNGTTLKRGATLVDNGDFVCNGHMHTCQSTPHWAAIGPPWQIRMGDDEERYFGVVEAKYRNVDNVAVLKVDIQKVRFLPTVTLRQVYVETEADFSRIHNVENCLYSVTVAPGVTCPAEYFKAFRNILYWKAERLTYTHEKEHSVTATKSLSDLLLIHMQEANLQNDVAAAVANIHQSLEAARVSEVRRAVASLSK